MSLSKGAQKLKEILKELYGHLPIQEEYYLGSGLRLDFYISQLNLGYE